MFGFSPKNTYKPLPGSGLTIESMTSGMRFLYYDTVNKICYATDSATQTILYESRNSGKTWNQIWYYEYKINGLFKTSTGAWIIWNNGSRLVRATPDFSTVAMKTDANRKPPLMVSMGVAEKDGVIMYAEYGHAANEIYKSVDDGNTWTIAHDGTGVLHWHTLQNDPYTGHWWVSSGDSGTEVQILKSVDDGATWVLVDSNSQELRCIGFVFRKNEILWGTDSAATVQKVFKSDKTTWARTEVGSLNNLAYCVAKTADNKMLVGGRVEPLTRGSVDEVIVYLTNGTSIKELMSVEVTPGVTIASAIISQVDDENRVWIWFTGTKLSALCSILLPWGY